MSTSMPASAEIEMALQSVLDPCSQFNGTRLNIVEMGLVRDIQSSNGHVHVRLLLTDPACLFYFQIAQGIEATLGAMDGVKQVSVESTFDTWWSEERMSEGARQRLGRLRSDREAQLRSERAQLIATCRA